MFGAMDFLFTVRVMTMANIFYIIGASGSGKDSLIRYARENIPSELQVVFTHRYITRPANAGGENHIALNEKEFFFRQKMGCFAMNWYSHSTHYGIGIEINQWLAKGINVVMNGSRGYLEQAIKRYPELKPVLIRVDPNVLRKRLELRGRENENEIEQRLKQAIILEKSASHPQLITIDNNDSLNIAGEQLITVIQSQKEALCV